MRSRRIALGRGLIRGLVRSEAVAWLCSSCSATWCFAGRFSSSLFALRSVAIKTGGRNWTSSCCGTNGPSLWLSRGPGRERVSKTQFEERLLFDTNALRLAVDRVEQVERDIHVQDGRARGA